MVTNKLSSPEYNFFFICTPGTEKVIVVPAGARSAVIDTDQPVPVQVRVGTGATIADPAVEKLDGTGPALTPSYSAFGPIAVEEGDEIHLMVSTLLGTAYSVTALGVSIRWGVDDVSRYSAV